MSIESQVALTTSDLWLQIYLVSIKIITAVSVKHLTIDLFARVKKLIFMCNKVSTSIIITIVIQRLMRRQFTC
jgi:hypothetical protein